MLRTGTTIGSRIRRQSRKLLLMTLLFFAVSVARMTYGAILRLASHYVQGTTERLQRVAHGGDFEESSDSEGLIP